MSKARQMQNFVAPGVENSDLNLPSSPWVDGLWVRIPYESWQLIKDYVLVQDEKLAEMLEDISWAKNNNPEDEIFLEKADAQTIIDYLTKLKAEIKTSELFQSMCNSAADKFLPEEYQNMLDAIIAVLKTSIANNKPFRAFPD